MYDSVGRPTEMGDSHTSPNVSVLSGEATPTRQTHGSTRERPRPEEVPTSIRWVQRILAVLILLCLALAAWVWAGILHGL